jgi:hypothetical protein
MDIYIFTAGREDDQVTWSKLPAHIQDIVTLVVYEKERYSYNTFPNVMTVPNEPRGIGHKRQYVLENTDRPVLFLDDDLTFAVRRTDDPHRFTEAFPEDIELMLGALDIGMSRYAHGGISMREGANRQTEVYLYNTRVLRVHYYNTYILNKVGARFDRLPCMEDFDMSLQLLRAGYSSRVINGWVHNQSGSNKHGGCSQYRTLAVQAEAAHGLKELHPDFVTVVQRPDKGGWGGGRTDVRIAWKKALKAGLSTRGVHRGTL